MRLFQPARSNFYQSKEWRQLRRWALSKYGNKCMSCGSTKHIQVDHIKPTSLYWGLRLKKYNLQIICKKCNLKKSNVYIDDLRPLRVRIFFIIMKWIKRLLLTALFLSGFLLFFFANTRIDFEAYRALFSTFQTQFGILQSYFDAFPQYL